MKHLWEVDHAYYCSERMWNSRDEAVGHKTWASFIEEEGGAELDYNLVFRWDWYEGGDTGLGGSPYTGDDNYRNGELRVFFMGQRKGYFRMVAVEVCRADEAAVRAYLDPRWAYLKELWAPLADGPSTGQDGHVGAPGNSSNSSATKEG